MTVVPGTGPTPCRVMIVGEAPGRLEAALGKPFVGPSGVAQEEMLNYRGLSSKLWYRTNIIKEYRAGNPDPTPEQIATWSPVLEAEIEECRPDLIIAVGGFAARWFLGYTPNIMEAVHGLPHRAGAFDEGLVGRGGPSDAVVLPVYHPAMGLHDPGSKALVDHDYWRVREMWEEIRTGRAPMTWNRLVGSDRIIGTEYLDVDGEELASLLLVERPSTIGLDTEGVPSDPWSIQVSWVPSFGVTLRQDREDFEEGIRELQKWFDTGTVCVMHNAMYDIEMSRVMGLDLSKPSIRVWDTMYAAYLMKTEPQGLKSLAYRWCGMEMQDFMDVVGESARGRQVDYLKAVAGGAWPEPEPMELLLNDGTTKGYNPQSVQRRAQKILYDYEDDPTTDLSRRWKDVDEYVKGVAVAELGEMPGPSLEDIPLDNAVRYASRDADAALRLYYALAPELERRGLNELIDRGMQTLPVFEEMQAQGMPASRRYFQELADQMTEEMLEIGGRISKEFNAGDPFNPASDPQVRAMCKRRGIKGTQKTGTGKMSVGKKSIQHLRGEEPFVTALFDWKERQHVRDSFCKTALGFMGESEDGGDTVQVRCDLKVTRTETRRLASADPNLLAIPARTEIGKRVRAGYRLLPDSKELLGAWDLSQIEMRGLAHESGDLTLCQFFIDGVDTHTAMAARMFEVEESEVTPLQRFVGKTCNFLVVYGGGASNLCDQLAMQGIEGWDEARAQWAIDRYYEGLPGVLPWKRRVVKEVLRHPRNEVRDYWGVPRYLPNIRLKGRKDQKWRAEAERHAVSHKIQGLAQGMIQNSMNWIRPKVRDLQDAGLNVRWVLQIHDEVILRFDEELKDVVEGIILEGLKNWHGVDGFRVPVEADGAVGKSWAELK